MRKKSHEASFDPKSHKYTIDGVIVPSVTGLIQEFGLVDYSAVPRNRLEYKRVLGMAVDLACSYLDRHELDKESLDERIRPYVEAYEKFCRVTGFEIDSDRSQTPMYSAKWLFGGTNDMVGLLNDQLVLIDRKCTWTIYQAAGPQLAGYEILWSEKFPKEKITKRLALQLKATGNYELEEFKEKMDYTDFLSCVHLHWRKRNHYNVKIKWED